MDYITKGYWWKAAGTRALKTFCQTFVAMVGTGAFIHEIEWVAVLSASVLAAVLSIMTSLAGLPEVDDWLYEDDDDDDDDFWDEEG